MKLWTTFCPSKICWELTYAQTEGMKPTSDWLNNQTLIEKSLEQLKAVGIVGIRLVIFPSEVTTDGKKCNWIAVDTMLTLCKKYKFLVNFCLGPFQYPYYPGIYLPPQLLHHITDNENALDTIPSLRKFGITFLQTQLERYGEDSKVESFHFANEWPDRQHVAGKEKYKKAISEDFMLKAATQIKSLTDKPISLNTNIAAEDTKKITNTFANILTILSKQAHLGFDIYPSQENLWQKVTRIVLPYASSFAQLDKKFKECSIYFAEVEAQPWGNGKAWYTLINEAENPHEQVLTYAKKSLDNTMKKYIFPTQCSQVSLWGADFWLTAKQMGIAWPLAQIKQIAI